MQDGDEGYTGNELPRNYRQAAAFGSRYWRVGIELGSIRNQPWH
jgi:hypothetical protein